MHSLAYLSRQLAASSSNQVPRTPPSTPTSDRPNAFLHGEGEGSQSELRRSHTWSSRSFLIPSARHPDTPSRERSRSFSSIARSGEGSRLKRKKSLSSPPSKASTPKVFQTSLLRQFSVFRIFTLLYGWICAVWESVTKHDLAQEQVAVETETTSGDDKESEDERQKPQPVISVVLTPPAKACPSDDSTFKQPEPVPPPTPPPPYSPQEESIPIRPTLTVSPPSSSSQPNPVPEPTRTLSTSLLPNPLSSAIFISSKTRPSQLSTAASPATSSPKRALPEQKTLVLDLDETLIHSTTRPLYSQRTGWLSFNGFGFGSSKGTAHVVEVVLGGRSTSYHVYKRPFVDYFLRKVSTWYTLVIFTASMPEYADPVIDWLDAGRGIISRRFFRESCTQLPNGSYSKDLALIEPDLSRVCLVDNSPISYSINQANGIPIEGWTHDPTDEALLDLLPVLDSLRFTKDVRRVLGIRGFS